MRKWLFGILAVLLTLVFFCSCAIEPEKEAVDDNEEPSLKTSLSEVYGSIGEVSNVYDGYRTRFFSGENILNFNGEDELVFVAELVEYNFLTAGFVRYVEDITEVANAMPHQGYNITYREDRKYIEFCSYLEKSTGKIKFYEIRVFSGDVFNKKGAYGAKTCLFNSSMTKDITNNKEANLGFVLGDMIVPSELIPESTVSYDSLTGLISDSDNQNTMQRLEGSSAIKKELVDALNSMGSVRKIYSSGSSAECIAFLSNGEIKQMRYYATAEFSSVNDKYTKLFDEKFASDGERLTNGCFPVEGFTSLKSVDTSSSFIEICVFIDLTDGTVSSYQLTRIDPAAFNKALSGVQDVSVGTAVTLSEL